MKAKTLCVYDQFAAQTERTPEVVALTAPGRLPLTYAGLFSQFETVRASLKAYGLGRNDRVVMVLDNGPETASAFLAITSCATAVPLNPAYRADEFRFYLSRINARAIVVSADNASGVKEWSHGLGLPVMELVPRQAAAAGLFELHGVNRRAGRQTDPAGPDDVALILHTSGTTSAPKMVPLTHRNICAMAGNNRAALDLRDTDLCLNVMPLFHSTGLVGVVLASLISGAGVVCAPGFHAPLFFEWLREFQPTWLTAVPSMHQAILARSDTHQQRAVAPRLRFIRSSSAALPPQLMSALERTFHVPVLESYGMTECGMIACNPLPPRQRKPGSAGVATSIDLRILDQGGRQLPPGAAGDIVVRGACVIGGYDDEPGVNEQSFTEGWFKTGDQGFLDDEGYLFITGRLKEIINRGGEKIAPLEVDQALLEHPLVKQAVTFPVANDLLGEEVAAVVVLSGDGTVAERELREFVSSRLAAFKVPRQILMVSDIPKGLFGKIQRSRLAAALQVQPRDQGAPSDARQYVAPRTEEEVLLAGLWSRILGVDVVGIDDDFFRLGGDSVLATQLVSHVRQILGVELSPIAMFDTPTIAGLVRTLRTSREKADGVTPSDIKPLPRR